MASSSPPRRPPPGFTSHSFTPAHSDFALTVRVWPAAPQTTAPSRPAPVVLYTHGGGWMAGNHYGPLAWMHAGFCRLLGVHLVSHNYRLGPQASVDAQLDDCLAAAAWCREELPRVLGGAHLVDTDRLVVCGDSAGALLTAMMGLRLVPPPRVVVCVYGAMDPASAWPILPEAQAPALVADENAPPWKGAFSEAELEDFLKDRDPANMMTDAFWWDEDTRFSAEELSEWWSTPVPDTRRAHLQAELHRWRADAAARPASFVRSFVLGTLHAERFASRESLLAFVRSMSAPQLLAGDDSEAVAYPPTAFLHGTGDADAPVEQSLSMARTLRAKGGSVLEVYAEGRGHNFDTVFTVSL